VKASSWCWHWGVDGGHLVHYAGRRLGMVVRRGNGMCEGYEECGECVGYRGNEEYEENHEGCGGCREGIHDCCCVFPLGNGM
jgi:hypothetical protein